MATAWSDTALGTADGPTVVSATNATLRIAHGINLADRIELQNSQGIEIEGGLSFVNLRNSNQPSTLSGPIDLGNVGSIISGDGSAALRLEGPISGGNLIRTSFGNRMDQLIHSNPANTFTGDLDLRGGITILSGARKA